MKPDRHHLSAGFLSRVCLIPGPPHALWNLLAPADALDPWILWWILGAGLTGVGLAALWRPDAERQLSVAYHLCLGLIASHLLGLAFLNDMATFYAVGSALAITAAGLVFRSPRGLTWFIAGMGALAGTLFALDPDRIKIACWAPPLVMLTVARYRLAQQIRAEERVLDSHAELERRVEERSSSLRERTQELSIINRKLRREIRQNEVLAEQLRTSHKLEVAGIVAEGLAHDFGNLTTVIGTYVNLLYGETDKDDPRREDLRQVQKATAEAQALVDQLLAFSRPDAAVADLIDIHAAIRDLAPVLTSFLGKRIQLELALAPGTAYVRINRVQLGQVVVNLADNAKDAMSEAGRFRIETSVVERSRLPLRATAGLEGDRFVRVIVSDDGPGMPREVQRRAFDPFYTTGKGGRGLGLSIVHRIVRESGGQIRLRSRPREGTRFEICWREASDPDSPS